MQGYNCHAHYAGSSSTGVSGTKTRLQLTSGLRLQFPGSTTQQMIKMKSDDVVNEITRDASIGASAVTTTDERSLISRRFEKGQRSNCSQYFFIVRKLLRDRLQARPKNISMLMNYHTDDIRFAFSFLSTKWPMTLWKTWRITINVCNRRRSEASSRKMR